MSAKWGLRRLSKLMKIQNGFAFDSKQFGEEGIQLIRIRDLRNGAITETRFNGPYDQRYMVTSGDFLIGMDGEFACYEWRGEDSLLNQRVCKLYDFSVEIYPRFLFLGLNHHLKAIQDATSYTTVKHIASSQILDIEMPIPSRGEQERIVAMLDKAFEGISAARTRAEANIHNARLVFSGSLNTLITTYGVGWRTLTLGEICEVERGSSPRPIKDYFTTASDGVNWIKIGDAVEGEKYISSTKQQISPEGAKSSRFVQEGDFVVTNSMSFGRSYIMKTSGYIHDGWFVLRLKGSIDRDFLYHVLSSKYIRNQFQALASGSVVLNISGDLVKRAQLPIPPLDEQEKLAKKLDELSLETSNLESLYVRKIAALNALKESLLHHAFSGNL